MIDRKQTNLIPFVMAGYPSLAASLQFAKTLIEEGATILEIGLPFSDPLADGPMIQKASERALQNGVGLRKVFTHVRELKACFPGVQVVLFTYLNPLLRYGLSRYVADAVASGIVATLTVDLPPEEAAEYCRVHEEVGLKTVFLASPTTSEERLRLIDRSSTGFVYYVSRVGVTGEAQDISGSLSEELARVRTVVSRPIAVGFGISTPGHAAQVAPLADAVVIGSRILRLMNDGDSALRDFARATIDAMAAARGGAR